MKFLLRTPCKKYGAGECGMLTNLILVLVFLASTLFFLGIVNFLTGERRALKERVLRYTSRMPGASPEDFRVEKMSLGREILHRGGYFFTFFKITEQVEEKLARADLPLRGEEFLFLNLILTFGVPVFLWLLTRHLGLAVLGGLFFLFSPWVYLKQVQQKRVLNLNSQLADSLMVITNSLRAGYSFLQAMEMVGKEMPPPIAAEFGRAFREMQLGTATEAALSNLSRRVGSEDLDLVITALLIQRQIGGNLAEILDNIAETIRERVRIKGEIRTLTAQGRISGLIVGALPLVLLALLFLINPGYVSLLFKEPIGLVLFGGAAFGEILGVIIIRRIVEIEV